MRFEFDCSVLLNYSPRGTSEIARASQIIKGRIKNGEIPTLEKVSGVINEYQGANVLREFFTGDCCLVPIPRSSPLIKGALWPTKTICENLVHNRIGSNYLPLIVRRKPVAKSSRFYNADDRPSIQTHIDSLEIAFPATNQRNFVLIDDILTLGRTSAACAWFLKNAIPDCTVKIFAVMRTMGRVDDISKLVEPRCSKLFYNTATGKSWIPNLDS